MIPMQHKDVGSTLSMQNNPDTSGETEKWPIRKRVTQVSFYFLTKQLKKHWKYELKYNF